MLATKKPVLVRKQGKTKGAVTLTKKLTVQEIEQRLGFYKVEPIRLTSSDAQDMNEKDDELREWYEDELKRFYERASQKN